MKYLIIIFSLFSSLAFADELTEKKACLNRFAPEIYRYTRLQNIWLTNEESTLNLTRNFNELVKFHETYFKTIKEYKDQVLPANKTQADLLKSLHALDEKQEMVTKNLNSILERDSKFLDAVNELDIALEEIATRLGQTQDGCSVSFKGRIESLKKDVFSWQIKISNFKNYTAIAREKRVALFELVHKALKYKLKKDFAVATNASIEKSLKQIDSIYASEKIQKEMMNFWMNNTRGDFLGGKTPAQAKETLYQLIGALEGYKIEIEKIENLPLAKNQLLQTYSTYSRTLLAEVKRRGL